MTFKELEEKLKTAKFKRVIYQHLVDHLEGTFRSPTAEKKILVTEDRIPVPEEAVGAVVEELFTGLNNVTKEIDDILGSSIQQPAPPQQPVPPAPEQGAKS